MQTYGETRAINELLAIFSCQWRNGMLPQIRFAPEGQGYRPGAADWGVTSSISGPTALPTSGITQPPIVGLCAWLVYSRLSDEARRERLRDLLAITDGLERFHRWLLTERDPWGENLALCLHPWETGTDNLPAFDPLVEATRSFATERGLPVDTFGRADTLHVAGEYRPTARDYYAYFALVALFKRYYYRQAEIIRETPFLLQDVLFNSLLAASLAALARLEDALAEREGLPPVRAADLKERAARNIDMSERVAAAIRARLWSERDGLFYSRELRDDRLLDVPTVSSFAPLLASTALDSQAERLVARLEDPDQFWTPVPLPSTSPASPLFDPVRYWSGPSWPVTNWLVIMGLRERGLPLAGRLRVHTLSMIAEGRPKDEVAALAARVLEYNSHGEDWTTPSRTQYEHAWLWDSAIVAASWPLVEERPSVYKPGRGGPGFWEYYHAATGEPLGAPLMSWTASLYLELLEMGDGQKGG